MSDRFNEGLEQGIDHGTAHERERIINDLKDQFAFAIQAETKEGLEEAANSIHWSERWQLTFNDLLSLIKGEQK